MAKAKNEIVRRNDVPPPALEKWEEEMANSARDDRATFASGIPRITVDVDKKGNLTFKADGNEIGQEIIIAVVEKAWSKQFYIADYKPGQAATPDCYAFGLGEKGLAAHVNSPVPQNKQADGSSPCDGCQHNRFMTAKVGKGKRCSDKPRLMVILAHDVEGKPVENVRRASCYQLDIPAASIGSFSEYLEGPINDSTPHGNVREALTKVRVQMRAGAKGHELKFEFAGLVAREAMPVIVARRSSAYDQLTRPFPTLGEEAKAEDAKPVKGQARR